MAHPPLDTRSLADRIVRYETGGSTEVARSAEAVEVVFRKLAEDLVTISGSAGVGALMGRALNLARRDCPVLVGVSVYPDAKVRLPELPQALSGGTEEDATKACAAVVAHLIELLVVLLGEDLGMQPVRRFWPHLVSSVREKEG